METPRKYVALRWIGMIASVVAWVVAVLGLIALIWVLANVGPNWARTLLVVLVLVWGVSNFLSLFVRGTVLLLLSDLENQARANARTVEQMKSMLDSAKALVAQPVKMEAGRTQPASLETKRPE